AAADLRVRGRAGPALRREVVILAGRSGLDRLADPGQRLECELRTEEQRAHDEDEYARAASHGDRAAAPAGTAGHLRGVELGIGSEGHDRRVSHAPVAWCGPRTPCFPWMEIL